MILHQREVHCKPLETPQTCTLSKNTHTLHCALTCFSLPLLSTRRALTSIRGAILVSKSRSPEEKEWTLCTGMNTATHLYIATPVVLHAGCYAILLEGMRWPHHRSMHLLIGKVYSNLPCCGICRHPKMHTMNNVSSATVNNPADAHTGSQCLIHPKPARSRLER